MKEKSIKDIFLEAVDNLDDDLRTDAAFTITAVLTGLAGLDRIIARLDNIEKAIEENKHD